MLVNVLWRTKSPSENQCHKTMLSTHPLAKRKLLQGTEVWGARGICRVTYRCGRCFPGFFSGKQAVAIFGGGHCQESHKKRPYKTIMGTWNTN